MADIELIIKISEEIYKSSKRECDEADDLIIDTFTLAIGNGIPLNGTLLNTIKTEIEQNAYPIVHGVNNHEKGMTLYGILQIIDKYRGESDCHSCKTEYDCYECEKYAESEVSDADSN